ncbi:zinc ribbon domain-containing protein [Arthrobacter castelli]|uniref:zinc ribbon domain-containing protein n=1 Tax=Arthrobacter castelli TaxID=271431 RepID=UPI0003FE7E50|nr:C4-type zinc ribbon domain-containing protein [Arthrobacter castelli]
MAKAAAADQLKLLDLQALDTKLAQLSHRARTANANPDIAEADKGLSQSRRQLVETDTAIEDTQRELTRAENDVEMVVNRIDRDQKRLDSGAGTSKDLTALQSELESLAKRRSDLEDVELEVMERMEALTVRRGSEAAASDSLAQQHDELLRQRDEELAAIETERESVEQQRAETADGIDAGLVGSYDKIRANHNGVGAGALHQRRCGACRMELNPRDLADIAKAAEDDVVRCEECGRILVRTAESGL